LLAIVEELLVKAMNNKILKCTDENINMNFLYVFFCLVKYIFSFGCARMCLRSKIYGPLLLSFFFAISKSHENEEEASLYLSDGNSIRFILNMICVRMANLRKAVENG
jgi:hypothetical protein